MPHSPSITIVVSPHQERPMLSHLENAVAQLQQVWVDVCKKIKHDSYPTETLAPRGRLPGKQFAEHDARRKTELLAPTHKEEKCPTTAAVSTETELRLKAYELIIDFITETGSGAARIRKRFNLHNEPPFRDILESLFPQKSSKMMCVLSVYHKKSYRIINIAQEPYQSVPSKETQWHPYFFSESKPFKMDRNPLTDEDDERPAFTAGASRY